MREISDHLSQPLASALPTSVEVHYKLHIYRL